MSQSAEQQDINHRAANMRPMTEDEIMDFAHTVRAKLGLDHVSVALVPEEPSICLENRIFLRASLTSVYGWAAKEEVLHEFAHACVGNGHGEGFYVAYVGLVQRFLAGGRQPSSLAEAQRREQVLVEALKHIVPREDPWDWHPVGPTQARFCYSCGWADSGHPASRNGHYDWWAEPPFVRSERWSHEARCGHA